MTPKEFHEKFPDEFACRDYWRSQREKAGIVCRKCSVTDHYWNHGKNEWRCRKCSSVTTIKTGTVMMHSNLPIMVWFKAMYEVMYRKKGISSTELYKQFPEIKSEGSAWYLLHKIRQAMGYRDEQYQIDGNAEIDDAFVTVVKEFKGKQESKRGRGSLRKAPILVLASYDKIPADKRKKNRPSSYPRYFKMFQMDDLKRESLNEKVFRYVKASSKIKTDAFRAYTDINAFVAKHTAKVTPAQKGHIELPWVHCAIGNLKRVINGIYHHVSENYLQNYLDEFIYKLNRRNSKDPFQNLINACLAMPWG
jgi:hypothetical protein